MTHTIQLDNHLAGLLIGLLEGYEEVETDDGNNDGPSKRSIAILQQDGPSYEFDDELFEHIAAVIADEIEIADDEGDDDSDLIELRTYFPLSEASSDE